MLNILRNREDSTAVMAIKKVARTLFRVLGAEIRPFNPVGYRWLQDQHIRTVLDVGANVGQFALTIHQALPDARIYAFEPLKTCLDKLNHNLRDVPKFAALNYALGAEDGEQGINRCDYTPSSSLLVMTDLHKQALPHTRAGTTEKISIRRLDSVVEELELEDNILVKIDTQGYEDKVIHGGRQTIARASVLIVETSFQVLYEGQPMFPEIYALLVGLGFGYAGSMYQLISSVDGSVMQQDSIFVKQVKGRSRD